jgi:hypothetical protein
MVRALSGGDGSMDAGTPRSISFSQFVGIAEADQLALVSGRSIVL